MNKSRLSIILPCFNEEKAVRPVLDLLFLLEGEMLRATGLQSLEVIIVDDASTDTTPDILHEYQGKVQVVRHSVRRGYGAAIKSGMQLASGAYYSFFDVDYTYDPYELVPLFHKLQSENLDLVCGDRLHDIEHMPFTRQLGNTLFRRCIRLFFGREVEDSCTGQRVFRAEYRDLLIELLPDDLNFSLAMTLFFLEYRLPFREIPIQYHQRVGKSKLSIFWHGPSFAYTIIKYWLWLRWGLGDTRRIRLPTGDTP